MNTATLMNMCDVSPSTYNPRKADPQRLAMVELSLRKLGFVLPIFADANGEILSGHQRHHVATLIGCKQVPVVILPAMELADRKALNIAFNRGTNDLSVEATPDSLTAALSATDIHTLAATVRSKRVDTPEFFRCLRPEDVPVADMVRANEGAWVDYAFTVAKSFHIKGITMPIIATRDLRVVNGIGRLQAAASRKEATIPVVFVSDAEGPLAEKMLNGLTMDFDIHTRYADVLRYNSFRRLRRSRSELGQGFIAAMKPGVPSIRYDVTQPANAAEWKRFYGNRVVDFGAGHLHETEILRSIGVSVAPFEPFRVGENDAIDKPESLRLTREFLRLISMGHSYTSVFISSVLNSVPFAGDRKHIARICAALCDTRTRLHAVASAYDHVNYRQVAGGGELNEAQRGRTTFRLDYEPGITMADFTKIPKVQKYHRPQEFHDLFSDLFGAVNVSESNGNVVAMCANPLPVDPVALRESLAFEFDLPYPDGSRMGLVQEALTAFSTRLKVAL